MKQVPDFSKQSKKVLVAGAASGFGSAISLMIDQIGGELILLDRDQAGLQALSSQLQERAPFGSHVCDVCDETELADVFLNYSDTGLNGVINCVGLFFVAALADGPVSQFSSILNVNLTAAYSLTQQAMRVLCDGGRIIHFASVSSHVANIGYSAYSSSKAGLSQLIKVTAREAATRGITVNAIGPAMTQTALTEDHLNDPVFRQSVEQMIPLGRLGEPSDVLGMVNLLLSDAGSFITGQTLYIDGGRTLC